MIKPILFSIALAIGVAATPVDARPALGAQIPDCEYCDLEPATVWNPIDEQWYEVQQYSCAWTNDPRGYANCDAENWFEAGPEGMEWHYECTYEVDDWCTGGMGGDGRREDFNLTTSTITADGSFAAAGEHSGESDWNRGCRGVIVSRHYSRDRAEQLRSETTHLAL
jgi:hypothetical protein